MFSNVQIGLLFVLVIFGAAVEGRAQKRESLKPPPETASLAETQEWLVEAISKQASYKTRVTTVEISDAKFEGCKLIYTQERKSGSISTATMGATRTTNVVKDDVTIDVDKIATGGVAAVEHIYPELQTLEIRSDDTTAVLEVVVKRDASDAIKIALMQARTLCNAKN